MIPSCTRNPELFDLDRLAEDEPDGLLSLAAYPTVETAVSACTMCPRALDCEEDAKAYPPAYNGVQAGWVYDDGTRYTLGGWLETVRERATLRRRYAVRTVVCGNCEGEFRTYSVDRLYCCEDCRNRAARQRQRDQTASRLRELACPGCAQTFQTRDIRKVYCSRACYRMTTWKQARKQKPKRERVTSETRARCDDQRDHAPALAGA